MNRSWHLTLATLAALSCTSEAPPGYAPYAGDQPYPDTRTKLVLPAGEVGFVTNSFSDTVDVFRMDPLLRLARYPVGRIPLDVDGPHHLVIDKARGALYVALSYPQVFATGGIGGVHLLGGDSLAAKLTVERRGLSRGLIQTAPGQHEAHIGLC